MQVLFYACIVSDTFSNEFSVQYQGTMEPIILDNLETAWRQDIAFMTGGKYRLHYDASLHDAFYKLGMTVDFFHFIDILPLLHPPIEIHNNKLCWKENDWSTLAIHFHDYNYSFQFHELSKELLKFVSLRLQNLAMQIDFVAQTNKAESLNIDYWYCETTTSELLDYPF